MHTGPGMKYTCTCTSHWHPLWNYSKSHTPGLKHICTCTSRWHSHSETTPNPSILNWNIPALVVVLCTGTSTLKLLQIPHSRTEIYLHLYFASTLPLWNYSKSYTTGLKHTCTCSCTSHWHFHTETTANPTLQDWNIPALVLRTGNQTLELLKSHHSRTEMTCALVLVLRISNPTLSLRLLQIP